MYKRQVYVARYAENERWFLQKAGAFVAGKFDDAPLAVFENGVELLDLYVEVGEETPRILRVNAVWRLSAEAGPHDTFFTHRGASNQPPFAQQDGDAWATALPLAAWPRNQPILDVREFELDDGWSANANDALTITVGLYNWVNGERLSGRDRNNAPLPNNGWTFQSPLFHE